jgi:hypothetical protein
MINPKEAYDLAVKNNINLDIVGLDQFLYGLNTELEHGSKLGKKTNITNNNKNLTSKIVIAHLIEDPFYYHRLYDMEKESEEYWKINNKPSIFN